MEVMEFIKTIKRYCENQCSHEGGCDDCRLADEHICNCQMQFDINFIGESDIERLKKWAKENPVKTRQSEFLKMFPNVIIDHTLGCIFIAPCELDRAKYNYETCYNKNCKECKSDYWLQEVE